MTHQRQAIREAAVSALVAATTAAGDRVFKSRIIPLRRLELPALAVYARDEAATSDNTAPRVYRRTFQLAIEGCVQAGTNVDDDMDSIAEEIENAMTADDTLGDTCADCEYSGTEDPEIDVSGDKPIGVITLLFTVTYETVLPSLASMVPEDDLETIDTKYDLGNGPEDDGGQEDEDRAEDLTDFVEEEEEEEEEEEP